ncbi:MAG: Glutaredoxin arsenate reductase [Alphaproteobacteria bacterium MarineAlpha2_Bin1]|nr:MAG: Glutaredoxin arsenate reductase [Alphaproteobacteria bacterium MarineAlpha2_Bin1]
MNKIIKSVLFVCNLNSVRSVMAEGLLKKQLHSVLHVESAGVKKGEHDNFAIEVMSEINVDISEHQHQLISDIVNKDFDIVITLSPEAQHVSKELTRYNSWEIEYWPCYDVSNFHGSREQILSSYREVREQINKLIIKKFIS